MATVQEVKGFKKIALYLGMALFRLLARTWKIELEGQEIKDFAKGKPIIQIGLTWHNRLAMAIGFRIQKSQKAKVCGLVSPSKDGALLADMLRAVKMTPVRGSSSSRAVEATKELIQAIEEQHYCAVITPDGPVGPIYRLKDGIRPILAKYTVGIFTFSTPSYYEFKSWDKFRFPKPFAKIKASLKVIEDGNDWDALKDSMAESAKA